MSKRIYTTCDGCGKMGTPIVMTISRYHFLDDSDETIDMCKECSDAGKYCCRHCRRVHSDDNPCEHIRAMAANSAIAPKHQYDEALQ